MKKLCRILTPAVIQTRLSRCLVSLSLFAIMIAIPLTSSAQVTTATITGTITDPGGSAVPAASVTARNLDTGLTRTVVSAEDGFYRITGRVDDVLNVSGHRIGTAEVENAINMHNGVIESAVVGYPHDIKGQGIYAYVIFNGRHNDEELTRKDILQE